MSTLLWNKPQNKLYQKKTNIEEKGQKAFSLNEKAASDTIRKKTGLKQNENDAELQSLINPYKSEELNTKYKNTVYMLENLRQKTGGQADVLADAKRLTDIFGQTVRKSYNLFRGESDVDYLSVAEKSFQDALKNTVWNYQYSNMTPEQYRQKLNELGYESQSTITARNQQNVLDLAKQRGMTGLTKEEEETARMYEEAARYGGNAGKLINGITGVGAVPLTPEGENEMNPYRLDAKTRQKYAQAAEALRAKGQITYDKADAYMQNDPAYTFAKEHAGNLNSFAEGFSGIGDIVKKVIEQGAGSLNQEEYEIYESALPEINEIAGGKTNQELTNEDIFNISVWGALYGDRLRDMNGVFSAYQPTEEQKFVLGEYRKTPEGAQQWRDEAAGTAEEEAAKRNYYFVSRKAKYDEVPTTGNWEEDSKAKEDFSSGDATLDRYYRIINNIGGARDQAEVYQSMSGGSDAALEFFYNTEEKDQATFNALMNRGQFDDARDYLDYMQYAVNAKIRERTETAMYNLGNAGGWKSAVAGIASIPMDMVRFLGAGDIYVQNIKNALVGDQGYRPVDVNTGWQLPGAASEAADKGILDKYDWKVHLFDRDYDVFDTLYSTVKSGVSSYAIGALSRGLGFSTKAAEAIASIWMGSNAAQGTMQDIAEAGGDNAQILIGGTLAGIFEGAFEKISIGELFKDLDNLGYRPIKERLKNIGKEALVNFSEEFNTEIANIAMEYFLMGDLSDQKKNYDEYIRLGMTEEEAKSMVWRDMVDRAMEAGLSGALMGAGFGEIANINANVQTGKVDKATGAVVKPETSNILKTFGEQLGGDAAEVAKEYDPKKATNKQTGEMARTIFEQINGKYSDALIDQMAEDLYSAGASFEAAMAIDKIMAGQELTPEEIQTLAKDQQAMQVMYETFGGGEKQERKKPNLPTLNKNIKAESLDGELALAPLPGYEAQEEESPSADNEENKKPGLPTLNKGITEEALDGVAVPERAATEAVIQQAAGGTLTEEQKAALEQHKQEMLDAGKQAAKQKSMEAIKEQIKAAVGNEDAEAVADALAEVETGGTLTEEQKAILEKHKKELIPTLNKEITAEALDGVAVPETQQKEEIGGRETPKRPVLNTGITAEALDGEAVVEALATQAAGGTLTEEQKTLLEQHKQAMFEAGKQEAKQKSIEALAKAMEDTVGAEDAQAAAEAVIEQAAGGTLTEEQKAALDKYKKAMWQRAADQNAMEGQERTENENGRETPLFSGKKLEGAKTTKGSQESNSSINSNRSPHGRVMEVYFDGDSGTAEARMEDGARVALEDAGLTEEQQQVAQGAADLPQEAQAAMTGAYDAGQAVKTFVNGFRRIYKAVSQGVSLKNIKSLYSNDLTEEQKREAVAAGKTAYLKDRAEAAADTLKTLKNLEKQKIKFKFLGDRNETGSGVYLARVRNGLSEAAKATLLVADKIAKAYGAQIRVYDHMSANGSYQTGSNIINVALDAEGNMLGRTISHELFHYVKEWGKDAGDKLQKYILDTLRSKEGFDFEQRKAAIIEQYSGGLEDETDIDAELADEQNKKPMTPEEAEEEMAAEGMLDVIDTEENLQGIFKATQDKGLLERIKNWLFDAAKKIKQALNDLAWNHPEVRALKDDAEYFQGLAERFKEALQQAAENYRMSQQGLYDSAKADPDVQAYIEAVKGDITPEAALEEANALASKLFARAEKSWIEQHMDLYEQGFEKAKEAMIAFGSGDVGVVKAFTDQGLFAPEKELFPALGYAGKQLAMFRQKNNAQSGTKQQRRAKEMDAEYMQAVADGDEEKAQRMVDEAAQESMADSKIRDEEGNLLPVYHGTSEKFTVFDMNKGRANMDIQGAFFSPWDIDAAGYGENVGRYYLNIKNPASESVGYKALRMFQGQNEAGKKAREYLISQGYDGVNNEDQEFIAFYPEQIKSADAITYDDNGDVIPPSERFNEEEGDIRWEMRAPQRKSREDYDYDALVVKPDMEVTELQTITQDELNTLNKKPASAFAKDVLDAIRARNGGTSTIYNPDTGKNIVLGRKSIIHSITHNITKGAAEVSREIDKILKNSVAVNELGPHNGSNYATVLLGIGETPDTYYVVRTIVNNFTHNADSIDVVHAIAKTPIKKEGVAIKALGLPTKSDSNSPSEIRISDFLNLVKDSKEMASVFSQDVAEKMGMKRPHNERISKDLLYSRRASTDATQEQEALNEVTDDPELYSQIAADEDIRAAWQLLMRMHRLTTAGGENALIKRGAFEKRLSDIVAKIEDRTGTKYGPNKLRGALRKIYQAMEQSQYSPGEILQYARDVMKEVLDASPGVLVEQDETTKDILAELKRRRFFLTDDQKSEIKNTYGTISAFTNKNFGTLHIVKQDGKTASLEDVWREDLAPKLPGVFAEDTSPLDMPAILDAWLETTKEKKYAGEFGHNIGAYATDLALNAMLDFYDVPGALKTKQDIREEYQETILGQQTRIRQLMEAARGAMEQAKLEYEERYKNRIEKAKERREETERKQKLRSQITRDVRAINRLNVTNSDTSHVPQAMQAAALKAVEPFLSGSGVFSGAEMLRLAREYKLLEARKGEVGGFDEDILTTIDGLAEKLNGRRLAKLDEAELQDLADIMGNLRKIIANENEAFLNGRRTTVDALSGRLKADMQAKGQAKQSPIAKAARTFRYREETPVYFADRVGGVIKDMINDFFDGETTWADVIDAAIQYKDEMLEKYHVADWINDKKHARFVTQNGDQIELNKQEALTLYAQWKRETSNKLQDANHLRVGGFMYGKDAKYKGVDTLRPHPLTDSDMQMIKSYLTEEEMAFADEMVKYLSEDMAKLGNEVSMRLYGYNKYTEPYYFPYSTDKRYLPSDLTQDGSDKVKQPKNKGFTKALMKNAATPLTIGNFMDMWANHVNEMALYKGFAESMDTMSRVFNQREAGEIRTDSRTGQEFVVTPESNWIEMERALGEEGVRYLRTLVRDISGGVRADERGFAAKGLSMFKKGAVLGNLSVMLQQPTAYARAMDMINPIYLNLVSKETTHLAKNIQEMYEYSGVAKIKKMGRFDTGTGKGAIQLLTEGTENRNAAQKVLAGIDTVAGIGAEKADEWTWGLLWGAVKKETEHTHPELTAGSEAFLKAVAERFNDICRHTQVYDSVMSKSTWMRSNSIMDKTMTSFMAEPTLTTNMLLGAMQKFNQPGGKKRIARAAGVFLINSLLVALAKSIMTATRRKDDEGRTWLEKYVAESAGNFLEDISPFGIASMIPWARDAVSMMEGYDVKRSDMDAVEQMMKGNKTLSKFIQGGNVSLEDVIQNTVGPVANMFGIPAKNLWRDAEAIISNVFGGASADEPTTGRDLKYSVLDNLKMGPIPLWESGNKAYYDRMEQALLAGDKAKYEELQGYLEETLQVKPDSITKGVKSEIKDSFNKELISDDKAMKLLQDQFGMDHDKAWEEVEGWRQNAAHADDEEYNYSKYREVLDLVKENKDITAAAKKLTDNTKTKEEKIDSEIQKAIGEWYRDGEITQQQAKEKLKKYLNITDSDDLHWLFDKWDYMTTGAEDNYSQYVDVYKAVDSNGSITAAMKEMTQYGYEEKEVKSKIKSHLGEQYRDGTITKATATAKLKKYTGITDENDLYWIFDEWDYKKKNANNKNAEDYGKYKSFYKAVETGASLQSEIARYTSHGVEESTLKTQITSQYKKLYLEYYQTNLSKAANLKAYLVQAYVLLGDSRSKAMKKVDDWTKDLNKKK